MVGKKAIATGKETAVKVVKEAVADVKKVAEEKKTAEVKNATVTEKTAAKKTLTKKKSAKKAAAVEETVFVQYMGKEVNTADIMKKVKEKWTKGMKKKVADLKSVTLYVKPEENKAYFVINGDVTGAVEL